MRPVVYLGGFAGDDIYAVFPSVVVGRTGMLGILVGMDQKDRYAFSLLFTRPLGAMTGAMGCGVRKTVEFPQLLSMQVVKLFPTRIAIEHSQIAFPIF